MLVGEKHITEYKKYRVTATPFVDLEEGSIVYEGIDYGAGVADSYWTNAPGCGGKQIGRVSLVENNSSFQYAGTMTESEYKELFEAFLKQGIDG